jgi:hypothetical protein
VLKFPFHCAKESCWLADALPVALNALTKSASLAGMVKIDNRQIGDGKVGPITKRLSELYAQRTAIEGVQVVD